MPKWDGDDVVTPQVPKLKDATSLQSEVSKLATTAKNADAPTAVESASASTVWSKTITETKNTFNGDIPVKATAEALLREAEQTADYIAKAIRGSVTLLSGRDISGWYAGSVPLVTGERLGSGSGGASQFFAHAPTTALYSEQEYRDLWLMPLINRLRFTHKRKVTEKHDGKVTAVHEAP